MLLRILSMMLACLALSAAVAVETPAPEQRKQINAILAGVKADDPRSALMAEEALVREGAALLPALRAVLPMKRDQLQGLYEPCKCANHWEHEQEIAQVRAQISTLDQAIFRLTHGVNPRKAIVDWAHGLKFDDGRAFTREFLPLPLTDVETGRLERVFPACRFYRVYLPGYQGGAAPPPEVLRQFAVPAPLAQGANLFAVSAAGELTLMTRAEPHLWTFFQRNLPPVATPQDAVYAWLMVTTGFWWWNNRPLVFLPVFEKDITATRGVAVPWIARGIIRVEPLLGNDGQIAVQMTFDAEGKLLTATETPAVVLRQLPLPPMAAPGGRTGVLVPE